MCTHVGLCFLPGHNTPIPHYCNTQCMKYATYTKCSWISRHHRVFMLAVMFNCMRYGWYGADHADTSTQIHTQSLPNTGLLSPMPHWLLWQRTWDEKSNNTLVFMACVELAGRGVLWVGAGVLCESNVCVWGDTCVSEWLHSSRTPLSVSASPHNTYIVTKLIILITLPVSWHMNFID